MRTRATLSAALALALTVGPAQALATPEDVAATHAYIEANHSLAVAMVAQIHPVQRKIEALNKTLAHECPGIGAGSPENEASQPISHEVAVALWSIEFGSVAGPVARFQRTLARLHWSSQAMTRAAAKYVRALRELSTVPLPGLCADVRSWKESGFQVIPAAALVLVERIEAIEPKAISPRLLAPFERGSDRTTLKQTQRLEQKIEESEFLVGQGDWIQVLETLALNE